MDDLKRLKRELDTLERIRASGVRSSEAPDLGKTEYRSDAELVAAIAAKRGQIAAVEGRSAGRRRTRAVVMVGTSGF